MTMVTREEKLIAQMKNIEAIYTDPNASAETKVVAITQQMSYLNMLVSSLIEPLREEAGDTEHIQRVNSIFEEFIQK